jgi:hypothetical protein
MGPFPDGGAVLAWPEWQALAARLGLAPGALPQGGLLVLPCDGDAVIISEHDPKAGLLRPGPDGYEVYHWPEFRALGERLGLVWGLPTRQVTLHLAYGKPASISQSYFGRDLEADLPAPQIVERHGER